MTPQKRLFDLALALVAGLLLLPLIVLVTCVILLRDGRPVFYLSERMRAPDTAFRLVKFRTMTTDRADSGVSGGDKSARITRTGRILRRSRLDEVPQLWNILAGDMSFVGPRPPLRRYVDRFPALYSGVLRNRPGITGLATLHFHAHEERLLSACTTPKETDAVYARRCVPRKARLDLLYAREANLCLDVKILVQTGRRLLRPRRR
ncbi:sugar transferase [Celeribacter indicus]|nr:sugar transferase [Celeribacter indicus]SDX45797.1 Sugar transferase involved in LPS biosynthesis (colanic, teichoic acid) [Celeribacter indicus]